MLADLIDPEVLAAFIDKKLVDNIRLAPLARIDTTLVGRDGDEISLPYYNYIGDAEDVAEGEDIPIAKLTQDLTKVKVSKIGKAVEFTDEALLSGAGNISNEAASQVITAVNSKVEAKLTADMRTNATLTATIAAANDPSDDIADALTQFGEDIEGQKVLVIPPAFYAKLRKSKLWIPNSEIGAEMIIRGRVGMVHGCEVVTSQRLAAHNEYAKTTDTTVDESKTYYEWVDGAWAAVESPADADIANYYEATAVAASAFIVKPGALAIYMKRNTLVEFDRDKLAQKNYIIASKLFAPYVYDKSKLIKLSFT
jgi:N4-gp56 family major capsid protein